MANAPMPTSTYPRDIPPLWLLLALVTMALLHWQLPGGAALPPPWHHFGWLVLAGAVAMLVGSAWRFRRAGTGIRPFSAASTLVGGGAYRFTRNPMYLGMLGIVTGVALGLGTLTPLSVPVPFFVLLDRRFVRREERFLLDRFGSAYADYCRRVRRWL